MHLFSPHLWTFSLELQHRFIYCFRFNQSVKQGENYFIWKWQNNISQNCWQWCEKVKLCFIKFRMWAMGYKPRPLLFVINPKAHKNQLVFQVQNFLFHWVTQVMIWVTNSSQVQNITLARFGVSMGIRLDKKFLGLCEYI